jgi:hypothetical protein
VVSLLIGVMILPRTWKLLRETVDVLMEATPKNVDLEAVRAHILEVPHVRELHDVHASTIASDLPVLTAHVLVDDECFHDGHIPRLLDQLQECLAGHFDVEHSTFQFEPAGHTAHEHAAHTQPGPRTSRSREAPAKNHPSLDRASGELTGRSGPRGAPRGPGRPARSSRRSGMCL